MIEFLIFSLIGAIISGLSLSFSISSRRKVKRLVFFDEKILGIKKMPLVFLDSDTFKRVVQDGDISFGTTEEKLVLAFRKIFWEDMENPETAFKLVFAPHTVDEFTRIYNNIFHRTPDIAERVLYSEFTFQDICLLIQKQIFEFSSSVYNINPLRSEFRDITNFWKKLAEKNEFVRNFLKRHVPPRRKGIVRDPLLGIIPGPLDRYLLAYARNYVKEFQVMIISDDPHFYRLADSIWTHFNIRVSTIKSYVNERSRKAGFKQEQAKTESKLKRMRVIESVGAISEQQTEPIRRKVGEIGTRLEKVRRQMNAFFTIIWSIAIATMISLVANQLISFELKIGTLIFPFYLFGLIFIALSLPFLNTDKPANIFGISMLAFGAVLTISDVNSLLQLFGSQPSDLDIQLIFEWLMLSTILSIGIVSRHFYTTKYQRFRTLLELGKLHEYWRISSKTKFYFFGSIAYIFISLLFLTLTELINKVQWYNPSLPMIDYGRAIISVASLMIVVLLFNYVGNLKINGKHIVMKGLKRKDWRVYVGLACTNTSEYLLFSTLVTYWLIQLIPLEITIFLAIPVLIAYQSFYLRICGNILHGLFLSLVSVMKTILLIYFQAGAILSIIMAFVFSFVLYRTATGSDEETQLKIDIKIGKDSSNSFQFTDIAPEFQPLEINTPNFLKNSKKLMSIAIGLMWVVILSLFVVMEWRIAQVSADFLFLFYIPVIILILLAVQKSFRLNRNALYGKRSNFEILLEDEEKIGDNNYDIENNLKSISGFLRNSDKLERFDPHKIKIRRD